MPNGTGPRVSAGAGLRAAAVLVGAVVLFTAPASTGAGAPVEPGSAAVVVGDPALGAYLAGECVTCHQVSGRDDGIPAIVGWPAARLVEAMNAFKARQRPNPVMQTIAARYSAEEIAALAVYLESVTTPPR